MFAGLKSASNTLTAAYSYLLYRVVDQDPQVANKPFLKDELLQMTQTE
jgi:hypothetical protein